MGIYFNAPTEDLSSSHHDDHHNPHASTSYLPSPLYGMHSHPHHAPFGLHPLQSSSSLEDRGSPFDLLQPRVTHSPSPPQSASQDGGGVGTPLASSTDGRPKRDRQARDFLIVGGQHDSHGHSQESGSDRPKSSGSSSKGKRKVKKGGSAVGFVGTMTVPREEDCSFCQGNDQRNR